MATGLSNTRHRRSGGENGLGTAVTEICEASAGVPQLSEHATALGVNGRPLSSSAFYMWREYRLVRRANHARFVSWTPHRLIRQPPNAR